VQTDDRHDEVEDLLRQVFDEARREGRRDLTGVHAAAVAEAGRLRRRHRQRVALGGTGGALVAAAVVATILIGPSLGLTRLKDSRPAGTATTATAHRWDALLDYGYPFHYRIPDVEPNPLPKGVAAFGSRAVAASGPGSLEDADLAGVAGGCSWSEEGDRRRPVAGRSWQYQTTEFRGSYSAGLGIAGFATGTGRDALDDMRRGALPCQAPELKPVAWPGTRSDDVLLLVHSGTLLDAKRTTTLAVRRVGDLLVSGSASSTTADEARRIATELADRTVAELVRIDFPPALGRPLGESAKAPNEASQVGAEEQPPLDPPAEYAFGDVFPDESDLPGGMSYRGDPTEYRRTPPAFGAQMCDEEAVAAHAPGQERGPEPVAGKKRSAWAASGLPAHPTVDLTVTGWATGTGAARFADLQANRGSCIWKPDQTREDWPGADRGTTWLSTTSFAGAVQYVAAQRVGDVIVTAVVVAPGRADARRWAMALSDQVAEKVRASGLPAAEGK
jgi:hypothetical protein